MQSLGVGLGRLTGGGDGNWRQQGVDDDLSDAGGPHAPSHVPLTISQDWIAAAPDTRLQVRARRRRLAERWWQGASAMFLCAVIAYGLAAGGHIQRLAAELAEGTSSAAARAGFTLQDLSIEGAQHTSREDIAAALGFGPGTSLLAIDTAEAQARIERLPWVRRAQVMRLLPSSIHVAIEEREPFAVWQLDGKLHLVAADGTVLAPAEAGAHSELPLIVGAGAADNAAPLFALLAVHPDLKARLKAAVRVADRRWSLQLANGVQVLLPEDNIEPALDKLAELDRAHGLLAADVVSIDLRLPDRIGLQLTEAAAQRWNEALKRAEPGRGKPGRDT